MATIRDNVHEPSAISLALLFAGLLHYKPTLTFAGSDSWKPFRSIEDCRTCTIVLEFKAD